MAARRTLQVQLTPRVAQLLMDIAKNRRPLGTALARDLSQVIESLAETATKHPQFFICHAHDDKKFVRKLATHLSKLGADVWLDEWELQPGDSLHGCIGKAISSAAYVGIVLSPSSVASRWCQSELDEALTREKATGKKVVIPLRYRLTDTPPFLAGRVFVNFS